MSAIKIKNLSLLLLLLMPCLVYSQNVTVKGIAKGGEGKVVRLKTYSDLISMREQLVATAVIDSNGLFELHAKISNTVIATLYIDYYAGELYLEPGKTLELKINNLVFNDKTDMVNHNLDPLNFTPEILNAGSSELNNSIHKLNIQYNLFLRKNMTILNSRAVQTKVDSFAVSMKDTFALVKNEYFSDYLTYRLATLELLTHRTDNETLMMRYVFGKPVQYDNIEYMTFFNQYFESYFADLTRPVNYATFDRPLNRQKSFAAVLDSMGKDTLLRNEILREAVLLRSLSSFMGMSQFNRSAILEVLKQISVQSKFERHRNAAANLLWTFTHLAQGSPAPSFNLKSNEDKMIQLADFRGRIVLLNFFTTWNTSALEELEVMRSIYPKFSDKVVFVSICCDREFMKLFYFVKDNKYEWNMVHLNNDYDLLESYGVQTLPYFAIINKDGTFYKCPAPMPSENLEMVLNAALNKK
ncbi:MAG: TlpA disulfide reductase family protein [Bacteroidota bacterium]